MRPASLEGIQDTKMMELGVIVQQLSLTHRLGLLGDSVQKLLAHEIVPYTLADHAFLPFS